jgi:hypothetical protein
MKQLARMAAVRNGKVSPYEPSYRPHNVIGAFLTANPASVNLTIMSRPAPSLSIHPRSRRRRATVGADDNSKALTQPRPRSRCINWRSLWFGVVVTAA